MMTSSQAAMTADAARVWRRSVLGRDAAAAPALTDGPVAAPDAPAKVVDMATKATSDVATPNGGEAAGDSDDVGAGGRCPICLEPYKDRAVLSHCFRTLACLYSNGVLMGGLT